MDDVVQNFRQQRGLALAQNARIKQIVANTWFVPSQSQNSGGYVVDSKRGTCTCPDHELRGAILKCKHRYAVEFARHHATNADGSKVVVNTMRISHTQNWPAYNAAQCEEKDRVQILAQALCAGVHNPPQLGRGRRRAAMSDLIFAAIMKTFVGLSGRRASSDIRASAERGLIDHAPAYNTVLEHFESPDVTAILEKLVRVSALPLSTVETKFAIDGTGFGSKVYKRWFDAKYGREMKEAHWLKLHAICGVTTNIITAVTVTDATLNDSPLLPQLVKETAEGFVVEEVSADKAYLGLQNLKAIEAVNAKPFIAFKVNSTPGTVDVWKRAYHMFAFHREEWLQKYHLRSNIESTFSSMKRKFGGAVRAKKPVAMANEVLLKVLCHNLSMLVHAIHELGIAPQFWTSGPMTIGGAR